MTKKILNSDMESLLKTKLYRMRFLISYVIIGFLSIVTEIIVINATDYLLGSLGSKIVGAACGIAFAFILNAKLNFKIPKPKMKKAFLYFVGISLLSLALNFALNPYIQSLGFEYEYSRMLSAGCLFYLGYYLHRRFSFKEFKKVGVAVYATAEENIKEIWDKIGSHPDFIHIDIVDSSFSENCPDPSLYRLEAIKAYWPNKEIHCHIMSKTPSIWLDKVLPFVDICIIHVEASESILDTIQLIKKTGRKVGLCAQANTPLSKLDPYIEMIDEIQLLSIPKPGQSGQKFDPQVYNKVHTLNAHKLRSQFCLSVDGGITTRVAKMLPIEKVVSGSFVLNYDNPALQIMRLQTDSRYEIQP